MGPWRPVQKNEIVKGLRHETKMAFIHKVKRIFDWKIRPFLKYNEDYEENVKIIFCENVGEKNILEENCAKHFEEIKFSFTSPGTPQQNSMVERVFATLYSQMSSMMEHKRLHENLNTGIWTKCAATSTKIKNIIVGPHK